MAKNITGGLNVYSENVIRNTSFNNLKTTNKQIINAINEIRGKEISYMANKLQPINDNSLVTNSKTIVNAINEIAAKKESVRQQLASILNSKDVDLASANDSFDRLIEYLYLLPPVASWILTSNRNSVTNTYKVFNSSDMHTNTVQSVNYGAINGYVYVKYVKDTSQDHNSDVFKFKVRFV